MSISKACQDRKRIQQIEAIRQIISRDPATHHLNAQQIAFRLYLHGVRVRKAA
jgi:hypothetical protein